jgi:hypothetical protein
MTENPELDFKGSHSSLFALILTVLVLRVDVEDFNGT